MTIATRYQISASASLIALIFLCLAWEGWLFGILRGKRYTYKWLSLFIQLYLMEGALRATSDHGLIQKFAIVETVLAAVLFVSTILYIRATRTPKIEKAAQQS